MDVNKEALLAIMVFVAYWN